ncbi:DUF2283 domain-containing protein [Pseudonocardia sichuanensis]
MELTYDPSANAAYLALGPRAEGDVAESIPVTSRAGDVGLVVDLASDGRVLGIEFLDASRQLPGCIEG